MVTRSSLVWVMTGIAAGIAGGWLWNRERRLDVAPSAASASSREPIRSPFTQRREERATYLTPSDAGSARAGLRATARSPPSEFSHRQSVYESASRADREQLAVDDRRRACARESGRTSQHARNPAAALRGARRRRRARAGARKRSRDGSAFVGSADRGRTRADLGAREAGDESCRALRVSRRSRRRVGRAGSRACVR